MNLVGQSLGRYHILEQIGEGGMAIVYKAYDTRLESEVAVKVIRTENILPSVLERALKRFEREAKALAKLTHPNIVKVSDYGQFEGVPYLVMPYLLGGTLKENLGKPMPWKEAIQLLSPIAEALDYAHSQNMVHRDVKPSNILLTERGQPMLTDFGIAKVLDVEETMDLTGTSAAVGTPEYMAPEQVTAKTADHRADIYALGIVLYEMVTGRKPYTADTPMAVLIKQATDPLPRPTKFVSNLPDAAEKLLLKALAKDPDDRYQSMAEMAVAMENLQSKTIKQVLKAPQQKKEKEKREKAPLQRKWLTPAIITLVLVGMVLGGVFGIPALQPQPENTPEPIQVPVTQAEQMRTPTNEETATVVPSSTPTKDSIPTALPLPTEITDDFGVEMVLVPEGEFKMGFGRMVTHSDWLTPTVPRVNRENAHLPVHAVYLDSYYIDKYEVTNLLYQECVGSGSCNPPFQSSSYSRKKYYGDSEFDDYPVVYITREMASTFCNWRGARLPTEAEWEKAARGTDERLFAWGNGYSSCDHANITHGNPCVGDTTQVGSYPNGVSPYGVYDMTGNVMEWVSDWHDDSYYENSPASNPHGPEQATGIVVPRGGSWKKHIPTEYENHTYLRYLKKTPNDAEPDIGFRCAKDANPQE